MRSTAEQQNVQKERIDRVLVRAAESPAKNVDRGSRECKFRNDRCFRCNNTGHLDKRRFVTRNKSAGALALGIRTDSNEGPDGLLAMKPQGEFTGNLNVVEPFVQTFRRGGAPVNFHARNRGTGVRPPMSHIPKAQERLAETTRDVARVDVLPGKTFRARKAGYASVTSKQDCARNIDSPAVH